MCGLRVRPRSLIILLRRLGDELHDDVVVVHPMATSSSSPLMWTTEAVGFVSVLVREQYSASGSPSFLLSHIG